MTGTACLVCVHVGDGSQPVLNVVHYPADEQDAPMFGLTCGLGSHPTDAGRITRLERMIGQDPSLQALCDTLQPGQMAERTSPGLPWVVVPMPAEDAAA